MCIVLFLIRVTGMFMFLGVSNGLDTRLFILVKQVSYDFMICMHIWFVIRIHNRI